MTFTKRTLQHVASVVVVAYLSLLGAGSVAASEVSPQAHSWTLMAQASVNPATAGRVSAEEEQALRQIYGEKIQRLEGEMNNARGTRGTLLTVAVTTAFLGAGIITGSSTVTDAVEQIKVKNELEQENKDDALKAIDALGAIGGGIIGAGGVALAAYVVYSGIISSKQMKVEKLRAELDSRFSARGLTPEYLQNNESVAAVLEEIANVKKSTGTARTFQGFFSRIAIGSLLSGGFLYLVATAGQNVVDEIDIDETDDDEVQSREDARDETEKIETTGIILAGTGAACAIVSFVFGRRVKGKERTVDDLENSLLRVVDRIDFQPKGNGFAMLYSYSF